MGREISGKTVGIVGLGYIGQMVIRRLRGFDVKHLGYDPVISPDRARDMNVELVDLPELFARSDYVSLHVPENDLTRGMVNADILAGMKPGATIINCARAGVVNEADLREAKKSKDIRFLNDVYPKDAEGEKSIVDVADLMVPHLGASTVEANRNAARRAAEELIEFDEKGITSYIVNRDIPAGLDEAYGNLAFCLTRLCRHVAGKDAPLKLIETSFYGRLKPYGQWLLLPILSALSDDFSRSMDYAAARQYLKDMGIDYEDRETDDSKGFASSITVDLTVAVGADTLRRASVRGTVTEGNLMVSRVSGFDKLYFEPTGHNVVFSYVDRPGVIGLIGAALAKAGINIDDMRNPHDASGANSLAWLKVSTPVPQEVMDRIAKEIEASFAFYLEV
jgi:D-3-phosphoglycerate dehydrogenase